MPSGWLLGVAALGLSLLAVLPSAAAGPARAATQAPAQALSLPVVAAPGLPVAASLLRASRSRPVDLPAVPATPSPAVPGRPLPDCFEQRPAAVVSNGRLPDSALCALADGSGERLRADAAQAWTRLAAAYPRDLGAAPCVIDGYRTLAEQQVLRRTKPRYAARPGSSEHGWGLAVDLGCGVTSSGSPQSAWLRKHAGSYGWFHPDWAVPGGSRPEPWHWEYTPQD